MKTKLPQGFHIDPNAYVPGSSTGHGDDQFRPALYVWEKRTFKRFLRKPMTRTGWWMVSQGRDVKLLVATAWLMHAERV